MNKQVSNGLDSFEDLDSEFQDIKKLEENKLKEKLKAETQVKVFMND